jgi:hypothetical protein
MLKSTYTHGLIHHPHQKVDLFWGRGLLGRGLEGGEHFPSKLRSPTKI